MQNKKEIPSQMHSSDEDDSRTTSRPVNNRRYFNKDQLNLVMMIESCQDFYKILGVGHTAQETEIKRAYRKLALKLHPDKNFAPGASEAFKKVNNAAVVLLDHDKRAKYDNELRFSKLFKDYNTNGHENGRFTFTPASAPRTSKKYNPPFQQQQEQERHHIPRTHYYRPANLRQSQDDYFSAAGLPLALFCVLLGVIFSALIFSQERLYSFSLTNKYSEPRITTHLSIPYFVQKNFQEVYKGSMAILENAIEEDYIMTLKHNCWREQSYRESMKARAWSYGNRMMQAKAQRMKTPSCDDLARIGILRYTI